MIGCVWIATAFLLVIPHAAASQESPAAREATAQQEFPSPSKTSPILEMPIDKVVFDLQRLELDPKRWGFELNADGTGHYYAQGAPTVESPSGKQWQAVTVSRAVMERILAGSQHEERCETHAKHIANTGQKTLSYVHGDAWFTCAFNYSENAAVMKAADAFQAIAETIQFGARLQHERRFDRLSLDPDITALDDEVKQGRALELQNIASILKSIAEDERIIDRVRRKAARMLEGASAQAGPMSASEAPRL